MVQRGLEVGSCEQPDRYRLHGFVDHDALDRIEGHGLLFVERYEAAGRRDDNVCAAAEVVCTGLLQAVNHFTGDAPAFDDVAIMALRWRPAP